MWICPNVVQHTKHNLSHEPPISMKAELNWCVQWCCWCWCSPQAAVPSRERERDVPATHISCYSLNIHYARNTRTHQTQYLCLLCAPRPPAAELQTVGCQSSKRMSALCTHYTCINLRPIPYDRLPGAQRTERIYMYIYIYVIPNARRAMTWYDRSGRRCSDVCWPHCFCSYVLCTHSWL